MSEQRKFKLPALESRKYSPQAHCIYCGSSDGLSDEHIIPYGLGGTWVIPKASCPSCAKITGSFEGVCQRTTLGNLRMFYGMPTRRPKDRPEKLPLKVKIRRGDEWSYIDVEQEIFPFLILFPNLNLADEITGRITQGERSAKARKFWIRGVSCRDGFINQLQYLCDELQVAEIEPTGTFSVPEFVRMLAKIAHAFAVAELGIEGFTPFLVPIIKDGDISNTVQYVGGIERNEPPARELHQVSIVTDPKVPSNLITVRVRLFSYLEAPTYVIAVGYKNL